MPRRDDSERQGFGGAPVPRDPLAGRSLGERFGALRNLPPFLKLIWRTSSRLTTASVLLRLVRALLPVVTLYVGKLIIDEVLPLARSAAASEDWRASLGSGVLDRLLW